MVILVAKFSVCFKDLSLMNVRVMLRSLNGLGANLIKMEACVKGVWWYVYKNKKAISLIVCWLEGYLRNEFFYIGWWIFKGKGTLELAENLV